MAVLTLLLASLLIYRAAGALGLYWLNSWQTAARCALSTTLLVNRERAFYTDARRPRPHDAAVFPWPRALVYFTGVCEIAGAVGLMLPPTRRAAGFALIVFFIAVFPANVRAARSGVTLRGKPVTSLWLRAPMQVLFIFPRLVGFPLEWCPVSGLCIYQGYRSRACEARRGCEELPRSDFHELS